jgi:hypothetical protein
MCRTFVKPGDNGAIGVHVMDIVSDAPDRNLSKRLN